MIITEKKSKLLLFLIYAVSAAILLIDYPTVLLGIREGLAMCARHIVPSLFMLSVVSGILISSPYSENFFTSVLSRAFGLGKKCGTVVFFALIAGFPSGALGAYELYEKGIISQKDCEKIVYFTNNAGLAFIIGTVGTLMGDHRFATVLWISQTLASLTLVNLFRSKNTKKEIKKTVLREQITLVEAIKKSASAMIVVCAFVCFFTALRLVLTDILGNFIHSEAQMGFVISFMEIGNAVNLASGLSSHSKAICSFAVGFGGLSAILQSVAVCPCVKTSRYVLSRIMMGVLCTGYAFLISAFTKLI